MAGPAAAPLDLLPATRAELEKLVRCSTAPHCAVERARIVLLAAAGWSNAKIGRGVGCTEKSARKWRERFRRDPRVRVLRDAGRSGRPSKVAVADRCHLVKLACSRPDGKRTPFRDVWTHRALADALFEDQGVRLSRSEVGRILRADDIRPHHVRMWLHSPDPDFDAKVREVCRVYNDLHRSAHILCVDEKTCIQALKRRHPMSAAKKRRAGRFEFEYRRNGTRTLIAAYDVRCGHVYGECRPRRTAADLIEFMEEVAKRYPTGDVYIVWDNLNIHHGPRWQEFSARHGGRFHFVYTPKHASWLNQIEIWFGILQRRLLKYGSFANVKELTVGILGFIDHWNTVEAHPFRWTFRGDRRTKPDTVRRRRGTIRPWPSSTPKSMTPAPSGISSAASPASTT